MSFLTLSRLPVSKKAIFLLLLFFAVEARRKDNRLGAALTSIEKRGTLFSYKLSNEFNSPLLLLAFYSLLLLLSPFRTVGSGERIKSRTQRERECLNKRGGGGAVRDESRGVQTSLPSYTKQKRKERKRRIKGSPWDFF